MAAMPRPIDRRPKALVNLPNPSISHRIIEVSDINAAEIYEKLEKLNKTRFFVYGNKKEMSKWLY